MRKGGTPSDEFVILSEGEEAHWEVTERILFVYAKLNPGQGYVQVGYSKVKVTHRLRYSK